MNSRVYFNVLDDIVHHIREDCFRKPKLLLATNRLIYLNTLIGISEFHGPRHPSAP